MGFLLVLLLTLLAAGLFRSPREPMYQGRKLSAWLREAETQLDRDLTAYRTAAAAIRAIGTNALPTLLRQLTTTDPQWKVKVVNWAGDTIKADWRGSLAAADRQRARLGFQILGPAAHGVVPELAHHLFSNHPAVADAAFQTLADLKAPAAVPALVGALTSSNEFLHLAAVVTLGELRHQAASTLPELEAKLTAPDATLRAAAARAIGQIAVPTENTVSALSQCLSDGNAEVRTAAAQALGFLGTHAEAALPLLQALPESEESFRRPIARAILRVQCEQRDGALIRGPKREKRLALIFTGHEFAEGADTILNELQRRKARASFFLTGDFLRRPEFRPLIERMVAERHYLGPHSDRHLLYCSWEKPAQTLVTEEEFAGDLIANLNELQGFGVEALRFRRYLLPPYEHFNREIADWTRARRWSLINYTPGTRSHADYTGEADKNFTSSQAIFESIVKRDKEDPCGLNGFLLLLHVGSGPGREDKFHTRFGELLDYLAQREYEFVGVDDLLEPAREELP
jgi:peptidoglycan/xylan/chitin deacetylase (PgdA/CDA1 family)